MMMNRNKRGIAVNLKIPGGLEVVKRLLADADVVTENYRKGTLEKLGLGYDVLAKLNPRLIYCAVSGYGRTGPYADKPGFDLIAQGFAGIMSVTGEPGGPPVKSGTSIADINAGIFAALGIVVGTARARDDRPRPGRRDLAHGGRDPADLLAGGDLLRDRRESRALGLGAPAHRALPGLPHRGRLDQHRRREPVELGAHREGDRPQRSSRSDPRFRTNGDRMRNIEALTPLIAERLRTRPSADWIREFEAAGVPVGPVNRIGDMLADPQVRARDMVVEVDHAEAPGA